MRPVDRGPSPRPSWADYNDARPYLEQRLGDYCSYCEMPHATDVEHKLPKHVHPKRKRSWKNFLLGCRYCNGIKSHQQDAGRAARPTAALALYLWPDTDNTARAFVYHANNDVTVAPGLPPEVARVAAATLVMTGIDRIPGKTPPPSHKDKRWRKRREAWEVAEIERQDLSADDTPEQRARIGRVARATGFWSVWRATFAHDPATLEVIDRAFEGTAPDCFDAATRRPVARPRGRL
jgi:hypothetical protein